MHGGFFFPSITYLLSFHSSSRQMTNSESASPPPARLEPVPPSNTSILPQSQQSWWKDLPQAPPPPLIAGNIMHSNESQTGGFSFLLLRATYLGKQRGKEAVEPDEEVRKEWPPAWHIPSLHKSDFMALSHAALLQAQTAGFISVHYRHLHKSQALLGWEFMQEITFLKILPLLYISLLKKRMTALKPPFLVINSEGSVGICTEIQTASEELTKLMVEIHWKIPVDFRKVWVSLCFLSYHHYIFVQ